MKSILLTLGHNSSAIFVQVDPNTMIQSKPIGYEEERLNKIKSSSAFPKLALGEIARQVDITGATVYISHWFDDFIDPLLKTSKYYDAEFMADLMKKYDLKFVCVTDGFTHHDAHAFSVYSFLRIHAPTRTVEETDFHYIVADGFGNNQEVLSIYKSGPMGQPVLETRVNGYANSLGLLYQYATSFCGMKENQDEYKFLGYEAKIQKILKDTEIGHINIMAKAYASAELRNLSESGKYSIKAEKTNDLINLSDLEKAKEYFYNTYNNVLNSLHLRKHISELDIRIVIGYFIQQVIEQYLKMIIAHYGIKNVCLAGGVFYNVKLNNMIVKEVEGFVCINPLAGDQGAAIGLYEAVAGNFKYHDLCFGNRRIKYIDTEFARDKNFIVTKSKEEFVSEVSKLLYDGKIVNVMHGNMEFGPRALCNTSTLAAPTVGNVDYINRVNGRNTVMPMAPVILSGEADMLFSLTLNKVIGSNHYMVCTHDFDKDYFDPSMRGVAHAYPTDEMLSGRPQVLSFYGNHPIKDVLVNVRAEKGMSCLINTSFNTHGTPILYSLNDCISDFKKQREKDFEDRIYLVVLENEI